MITQIAAVLETFTFASNLDQASIFVRKWLPPCGIRPRATVQITHGIAEHGGRYDRFARFLTARATLFTPSTCAGTAKRPVSTTSARRA
jgi:hypothetical protein